jgi:hypothetical protein
MNGRDFSRTFVSLSQLWREKHLKEDIMLKLYLAFSTMFQKRGSTSHDFRRSNRALTSVKI